MVQKSGDRQLIGSQVVHPIVYNVSLRLNGGWTWDF